MNKFLNIIKNIIQVRDRVTFKDGSYIEYANREALSYVEQNGHRMKIDWYFQRGRVKGTARILYISRINLWGPPFGEEYLSPDKKQEIQKKIIAYCKKHKIPLTIKEG